MYLSSTPDALMISSAVVVTIFLTLLIIYGGNRDSAFVSFFRGDDTENVVGAGLETSTLSQKLKLIRNLKNIDTDYVILDLGAGTHQFILDMFLLSPQGIVVSAPAVTATLN